MVREKRSGRRLTDLKWRSVVVEEFDNPVMFLETVGSCHLVSLDWSVKGPFIAGGVKWMIVFQKQQKEVRLSVFALVLT